MNYNVKKEICFWVFLIAFVFCISIFNIIKVYKIRHLFFSNSVREDAISAIGNLRDNRGYGATDLNLKEIKKENEINKFYFGYIYHHPEINSKKKLEVDVKNKSEVTIKEL